MYKMSVINSECVDRLVEIKLEWHICTLIPSVQNAIPNGHHNPNYTTQYTLYSF